MLRLACAQFTATADVRRNLRICADIVRRAKQLRCQAVFLPEASDCIDSPSDATENDGGNNRNDRTADLATTDQGEQIFLRELAAESGRQGIDTFVGVHEYPPGMAVSEASSSASSSYDTSKCFNAYCAVSGRTGQVAGTYRKIHLFDVDLSDEGGPKLMESRWTRAGRELRTQRLPIDASVSQSAFSRAAIRNMEASAGVRVTHAPTTMTEAMALMRRAMVRASA